MTEQDPLGGFGLEGFDLNSLLNQAQQMQASMMAAQQELAQAEVEGTVADGLVAVTVNGTGELVRLRIAKGSFDPQETEDLEDLILVAYRDAKNKADALAADKLGHGLGDLGGMGGGLGLPGF